MAELLNKQINLRVSYDMKVKLSKIENYNGKIRVKIGELINEEEIKKDELK